MDQWKLKGQLPKLIQSFLHTRYIKLKNGHNISNKYELQNGIPQGSPLSVLLFAISINTLSEIQKTIFVDDLAIFYSSRSIEDIENVLQPAVNRLSEKASNLGLKFSPSKTKCLHFCRLRSPHNEPKLKLDNQEIEIKETAKFLGLTWDKKLNWHEHIKNITKKCNKALNKMRVLANVNWGSDRETLLKIYKSLVLSKMDYGSIFYSSARKSQLKLLDTIQASGLRLALGAFRTSPIAALCSEAGIPPLKYRRQELLLRYHSKLWAQPDHPNYGAFFDENDDDVLYSRNTITRPANIRSQETLINLEYSLPQICRIGPSEHPPWTNKHPCCHLNLLKQDKATTNHQLIRSNFRQLVEVHGDALKIYTDGSKTSDGVGSAFSCNNNCYSWTLPPIASVFTAELYAIWQSLKFAERQDHTKILICTDSLSAIHSICKLHNRDSLVNMIKSSAHWLQQNQKEIIFVWIPSHVGIAGNEAADVSAKSAAAMQRIDEIPVRYDDVKNHIRNLIYNEWQKEYDTMDLKLKDTKRNVRPWASMPKMTRRDEVVLTRLRIGHTNLTSKHLLRGEFPPECHFCDRPLTVRHILNDCPQYHINKVSLMLSNNIQQYLTSSPAEMYKILQFLRETYLYNKI
nr:unnamed protein product [Callosobruchus chinensis]